MCPNDLCQQDLTKHRSTSFFIEGPVAKQIQSFFAKDGFFDDLQYRFRRTQHAGQISDIYGGNIYKSLFENNSLLSNPNNISLTWNTDGVPFFKSSSFALWPLYFIVNELPYNKRIQRENMIFAGLWFGTNKCVPLTQRLFSFGECVTCQPNVWFPLPFNIHVMDFTVVVNAKPQVEP